MCIRVSVADTKIPVCFILFYGKRLIQKNTVVLNRNQREKNQWDVKFHAAGLEVSVLLEYLESHFCLFFCEAFQFREDCVRPSLNDPRFTPSPTKMLVTPPILDTYDNNYMIMIMMIQRIKHKMKWEWVCKLCITAWMFIFSSSKKSMELKGTPALEWILWKWSVLCVQLEYIISWTKKINNHKWT